MLRTMLVGSLPRPTWLFPPQRVSSLDWALDGPTLQEGHDDAVRLAVTDQERAGLDILTDGEQRRRHYIWGFSEHLGGIDFGSMVKRLTRGGRYGREIDVARVTGPVRRPNAVFVEALRFLKRHTARPVKVTLPGPMTTADTLADEHYGDQQRLAHDLALALNQEAHELAENGCDIVQFDEPCFNIFVDEVEDWGLRTLETAAQGVRAKTAVHICYGYGVPPVLAWKNTNTDWSHYSRTLPLLRTSSLDMISVECAASGVDPSVLGLARGKDLMVGVIDVGTEQVETPHTVADRIRAALAYVEPERLYPCTDCGLVPRSRQAARGKLKALADGARLVRSELIARSMKGIPRVGRP